MKKCFIYHRVSSEQQLFGTGIERQEQTLSAYVQQNNLCADMDELEPVVIADHGVSAFKGLNMSEGNLGKWMTQVKDGMWDGSILVLESIDRFSRMNPFTVMGYLSELDKHNITIYDVSLGVRINRANSAMLPIVTMSAQRAYEESKLKSDRIRDGWKRKRTNAFNNGTIVTNKRPKWIDVVDNKYVLNDKAKVVKEIFRLYQSGIGCPTIAKILQDMGDEWQFDRPWRSEAVHKVLRNRRVTGIIFISEIIRNYESTENPVDQKRYEMEVYPPVINVDEFELVQKILASRRPDAGRIRSRKVDDDNQQLVKSNIFSGIFRCGRCGEPMFHNIVVTKRNPKNSEPKKEKYRYIRCLAERDNLCDNKALRYETVERFIIEHIKQLDFAKIIKPQDINPEVELVRLKIEEEKKHIREYEVGIERLKSAGKRIPFDTLVELEESNDRLKGLLQRQSTFNELHIDTDVLKNVDPALVYDVDNIEIRSRMEMEIAKLIDTITLDRDGKRYTITINYRNVDVLKYVLIIEARKEPVFISGVLIEKVGDTVLYQTPSFTLSGGDGTMPQFKSINEEPLSVIDYTLLMNYLASIEGAEAEEIWMRYNFNNLFS